MSDALHCSASGDHPHENIPDVLAQASTGERPDAAPSDDSAGSSAEDRRHAGADRDDASSAAAHETDCAAKDEHSGGHSGPERRSRRRALISAPVRVRSVDVTEGGPDEISTTLDVSRSGFLFVSSLSSFAVGMEVAVTFPYSKSLVAVQAEQAGRVARVSDMPDGRRAVAIALRNPANHELVDSGGRELGQEAAPRAEVNFKNSDRPVILIVDADTAIRDTLKLYLTDEGYEVVAVGNAAEAHVVLSLFTPALLIAEIEGDDLPGYDLCARIKTTPRLQTVPVMLMTRSAYPSDYANAHSLGAVVCMAKPFRMERFGHVVRLLAPTPQAKQQPAEPRVAEPKRKHGAGHGAKSRSSAKPSGKHAGRNGSRPRK